MQEDVTQGMWGAGPGELSSDKWKYGPFGRGEGKG